MAKVADAIFKSAALTQQGLSNVAQGIEAFGQQKRDEATQEKADAAREFQEGFQTRQAAQADRRLDLQEQAQKTQIEQFQLTMAQNLSTYTDKIKKGQVKVAANTLKTGLRTMFGEEFPPEFTDIDVQIEDYQALPMSPSVREAELKAFNVNMSLFIADPHKNSAKIRSVLPNFPNNSPYRAILERLTITGVTETGAATQEKAWWRLWGEDPQSKFATDAAKTKARGVGIFQQASGSN